MKWIKCPKCSAEFPVSDNDDSNLEKGCDICKPETIGILTFEKVMESAARAINRGLRS